MKLKLLFSSLFLLLFSLLQLPAAPGDDPPSDPVFTPISLQDAPQALAIAPAAISLEISRDSLLYPCGENKLIPILSHRPGRSIAPRLDTGCGLYAAMQIGKYQQGQKLGRKLTQQLDQTPYKDLYPSPALSFSKQLIKQNRAQRRSEIRNINKQKLASLFPPGDL